MIEEASLTSRGEAPREAKEGTGIQRECTLTAAHIRSVTVMATQLASRADLAMRANDKKICGSALTLLNPVLSFFVRVPDQCPSGGASI
jgi:hypothetical protein